MITDNYQFIGVDLGGTTINVGKFTKDGSLVAKQSISTPYPSLPGALTIAICEVIKSIDPIHEAEFVGIGLPGPMDRNGRIARVCINLPGWRDVPLADWLESRLERKVTLANDGNCALLGELWKGAAKGFEDVLLLTLGTGVGGAVIIGGKLFTGHRGAASEPGLITIDPEGPICNSGNNGSLEQFVSIEGLRLLSDLDPEDLNKRAALGDQDALKIWEKYGQRLGIGISSLVYLFTPELVLIGGGLSAAASHFLPSVRKEVESRVNEVSREGLLISKCSLGNNAGCIGAARLAIERFTRFC